MPAGCGSSSTTTRLRRCARSASPSSPWPEPRTSEEDEAEALLALRADLVETAGRVLFNDYPTGVAVTTAQNHTGPYPAASDPRFTSVGARAIDRFLRPVTFQSTPDALLPDALKESNPIGVPRTVDGAYVD